MSKFMDESWQKIFDDLKIGCHNFDEVPFYLDAEQIKKSCQDFLSTGQKEVRILCKQDTRNHRPQVFKDLGLFILPVTNGRYAIIKGEGYVDIAPIKKVEELYVSKLDFQLDTASVGDSEMQHLDFAYASSLIRTFMTDDTLVLTIRGRKYTPKFSFNVGQQKIEVQSVQTEVDAGYEGKNQVVLVEAKNFSASNVIIRQLYYPFRQWQAHTHKKVVTLFFAKQDDTYSIWHYKFNNNDDYNSIELVNSGRYKINAR